MALIKRKDIEQYILTSLGHPVINIELAPENIATAIDTAINEYLSTGAAEIGFKEIPVSASIEPATHNVFIIPEDVATIREVIYNIPFQAAAGDTQDIFSFAVYTSPLGPLYSSFVHAAGNLGTFFEYLQNRNRVIGNDITFAIMDNKLYVYPYPKGAPSIIIKYSKNAYGIQDKDADAISTSNSWGTSWIRKMSLAICKQMLGRIRGKYSQVSGGPGNESQTLDGKDLMAEAKDDIVALKQELLEHPSHQQFFVV